MGIVFKRIFNEGIVSRPFKAHKRYEVTNVNYSSSFEMSILRGVSDNGVLTEVSTSVNNDIGVDTFITSSGAASSDLRKVPQTIIWNSINSTFFKRRYGLDLYDTASIFSIPQNKFGDFIKPKSVTVTDNSHDSNTIHLYDEKFSNEYGLLVASEQTSSTFITSESILYLSFENEIKDNSRYRYELRHSDINDFTFSDASISGKKVNFNESSQSIYVTDTGGKFNHMIKDKDWSISMFVTIPPSQSYSGLDEQTIVQKKTIVTNNVNQQESQVSSQYPFNLTFYTEESSDSGKIRFRASDGSSTLDITSSNSFNDGEEHHILLTKVGTDYSMSVDNSLESSKSHTFVGNINNSNDVVFGKTSLTNHQTFTGSLDEVRFLNRNMSDTERGYLSDTSPSGSALQKKHVGYVFYNQGMIIVTDPRERYQNVFLGDGDFDYTSSDFELNFRGAKTIEEISLMCEVGRHEFNVSSNASLIVGELENGSDLKDVVTTEDFRPYITQVGLYNDYGQLLAIAKLGSPLKKRHDVDVTINVKLDLD